MPSEPLVDVTRQCATDVPQVTARKGSECQVLQNHNITTVNDQNARGKTIEQLLTSPIRRSDLQIEDVTYPSGLQLKLITTSLCLCVFLVGLDTTVLATAIPRITDEFHSLEDVGWYGSAFRLTSSMVQLSQGKLFDNYSTKWMFFGNMVVFELGVTISATAVSSSMFVVGRAIAGIGFSGISQGCMVIIAMSTSLKDRPKYLGLVSASEFFAIAVAPLLGGVLTSKLSWRWCFYINIPIAVPPAVLLLLLKLPASPSASLSRTKSGLRKLRELDLPGCLSLAPAVFCLLLALQWGGNTYAWNNTRIIILLILAPTLFVAFLYIQHYKQDAAMLPPRIMRDKAIVIVSINSLSMAASRAIVQYYLTIWFQAVRGVSPLQSGINMLPLVGAILLCAVTAGYFISWVGSYMTVMIPAGLSIATGVGIMISLTPTSQNALWIAPLILIGAGSGAGVSCPFLAAQTVLQRDDLSKGMALMTFSQDIGEAVFVSIAQAVFLNKMEHCLRRKVPGVDPRTIISLGATNLVEKLPTGELPGVVDAYNSAITSTFYLATALGGMVLISACLMLLYASFVKRARRS